MIFEWIESASNPALYEPFPTLNVIFVQHQPSGSSRAPKALRRLCTRFTPRTSMLLQLMEKLNATQWPSPGLVELMSQCGISKSMLDTLPESVLLPMKNALVRCQASPPTTWNDTLLDLVDRDDLKLLNDVEKDVLKQIPSSVSLFVLRNIMKLLTAARPRSRILSAIHTRYATLQTKQTQPRIRQSSSVIG